MDVVQAIAALPRVKDNTGSPFFQAGKASGAAFMQHCKHCCSGARRSGGRC